MSEGFSNNIRNLTMVGLSLCTLTLTYHNFERLKVPNIDDRVPIVVNEKQLIPREDETVVNPQSETSGKQSYDLYQNAMINKKLINPVRLIPFDQLMSVRIDLKNLKAKNLTTPLNPKSKYRSPGILHAGHYVCRVKVKFEKNLTMVNKYAYEKLFIKTPIRIEGIGFTITSIPYPSTIDYPEFISVD